MIASMRQVLAEVDTHIETSGLTIEVLDAESRPVIAARPTARRPSSKDCGMTTVLWATGYQRSYPWPHLPVLDATGVFRQGQGRTAVTIPGLCILGQRIQHYCNSNFIDGVGRDAAKVADPRPSHHFPGPSVNWSLEMRPYLPLTTL